LFWHPGKWSLLRIVFFPSTEPPLLLMTCSAAACAASISADSISGASLNSAALRERVLRRRRWSSPSAGRGWRGCGSEEARVIGRRRDGEEAWRRKEREEDEKAGWGGAGRTPIGRRSSKRRRVGWGGRPYTGTRPVADDDVERRLLFSLSLFAGISKSQGLIESSAPSVSDFSYFLSFRSQSKSY
jgi:hypothetical protein